MGRKAQPRIWRDWYVTEAGGQGIHKLCQVTGGLRKAKQLLDDYLYQLRKEREDAEKNGIVQTDVPPTVASVVAEFLRYQTATDRQKGTLGFYTKNLARLTAWYGGHEVRKLKLSHFADFVSRLRALGLANTTINHHIRSAKAALNHAVNSDQLAKNPWRKGPLLIERKRKRIVTDEEFTKLLQACDQCIAFRGLVSRDENAQTMRDILSLLRFTALRPGELRKLRWDHVRLDEDLIIIPAAEQKTGSTAKEPEDRLIPILAEGKAILTRRKVRFGDQPLVFPNLVGKQWSDQLFSQRFSRLRERAGLEAPDQNGERIVPYSLRHTRLTEAATKEGWDFYTLMQFAGHTTPQMTKRYVHPGKEDLKRAAREGEQRRQQLTEAQSAIPAERAKSRDETEA